MKPNTITPELTHDREDIARQNRELRQLCAAILPAARQLVRYGVSRRTAQEASAAQIAEADALLKSVLAELDEYIAVQPDAAREQLSRELAAAEVAADVPTEALAEDDRQWMDQMAGDLAMAASAFWLELGDLNRQEALLTSLATGQESDMLAAFDLVTSRFHVGREGRALLTKLNQLTRPVYFTTQVPIDISAALYSPELTGSYLQK
ncbi:MAG TPA: hypothetical protein VJ752_06010 [Burkholderiaceae bacterium]|nr:hypothetical protein [Burkholderiaceae bacterium]